MNETLYRDKIIGHHFKDMLENLRQLGIITISDTYVPGKSSRHIYLQDWNIGFTMTSNFKFREMFLKDPYNNVNKRPTVVRYEDSSEISPEEMIDPFLTAYNHSLRQLQLTDKEGAIYFIETATFPHPGSYHYYLTKVEDFCPDVLNRIAVDRNNRLYHYLTQLPRLLRKYYNFRFYLDIHNSHPLLFSYYIINHYFNFISSSLIFDLFSLLPSINLHYDGRKLRNKLRNNGINVPSYKDLPTDVLKYLLDVMSGRFWDRFITLFDGMERTDVKVKLFAEIFYSKSKTTRGKQFGKAFVREYPHVWSIIRKMKNGTELPNRMMALESDLFHEILQRCYAKGWVCVNIHDALVLLDVPANEGVTADEARTVIEEVYHEHGLYPAVDVEAFQ